MKEKSQKVVYKDVVDLAETTMNIEFLEMEENNEEHDINLDADEIQHIAE